MQLVLAAWTGAALTALYFAIEQGLLGVPEMQISGYGSSSYQLNWMQDRIGSLMPRPWVLSVPLFVYRALMLAWALWLALALLRWLRWGWHCFAEGGLWRRMEIRRKKQQTASVEPPSEIEPGPEGGGGPRSDAGQTGTTSKDV
jgi:hypothetical protein